MLYNGRWYYMDLSDGQLLLLVGGIAAGLLCLAVLTGYFIKKAARAGF